MSEHLLRLPCAPLPMLDAQREAAIKAAASDANDRYITEFLEEHAFCPFSRGGRAQGQTVRFVHYASSTDVEPLLELMAKAAAHPKWMVVQVILPMIEVEAEAWVQFCNKLTALANSHLGTGSDVYAVAAMHPKLPYQRSNPGAWIPLFRRSPDPTIQWVRLDDLESLYEGRSGKTQVVDPNDLDALLRSEQQEPLFERITEANMAMAEKLGHERVEAALADFASTVQRRYQEILEGS
jgi:hypothetical protein